MRTILPSCFDHLAERFSFKQVQFKSASVAGVSKSYTKRMKLGGSVKSKEQREGLRQADILPNTSKDAVLPWGANCHMRTDDN